MIPRICRTRSSRTLALAFGLLAAAGAAAQTYTVTDLGSLGSYDTFAFAVSDSSRVAGYSYVPLVPGPGNTRHAFLWYQGQMQDLGVLPGGTYSWATDINEAGQVCGFADDVNIYGRPVVYRNGVLEDLGLPAGGNGESRGINNLTQIAGYFVSGGNVHASFWSDATGFVDLTAATGGSEGLAEDLNDHTRVVGWSHGTSVCNGYIGPRAAFWEDPGTGWTVTDLGTLNASLCFSHAYDINESGLVVGESSNFTSGAAVQWQKSGAGTWIISNLGNLGGPFSRAHAVNNRGQIVGESQYTGGGTAFHAALWQCGSAIDLNSRIPAGSGWVLEAATGINDLGEIVGYGRLNGGSFRGFLLKPSAVKCCSGISAQPL